MPPGFSNNPDNNHKDDVTSMGDTSNMPTDPYFQFQWYLLNTGQNGGKMRLDLNVQAAWDQGITGKNVTTAIMDDGECTPIIRMMIVHPVTLPGEVVNKTKSVI